MTQGEEDPVAMEGEDDEDDDGFFVPHGYLSEGEGDVSEPDMEADSKEVCTSSCVPLAATFKLNHPIAQAHKMAVLSSFSVQ